MLKHFVERTGITLSADTSTSSAVAKLVVIIAGGTLGWMLAYL